MFQINNLTKKFKKKEVLHDIELELETGVYGLLGENGAGKSTLIRCILGLYADYSGEIFYEGENPRGRRMLLLFYSVECGVFRICLFDSGDTSVSVRFDSGSDCDRVLAYKTRKRTAQI